MCRSKVASNNKRDLLPHPVALLGIFWTHFRTPRRKIHFPLKRVNWLWKKIPLPLKAMESGPRVVNTNPSHSPRDHLGPTVPSYPASLNLQNPNFALNLLPWQRSPSNKLLPRYFVPDLDTLQTFFPTVHLRPTFKPSRSFLTVTPRPTLSPVFPRPLFLSSWSGPTWHRPPNELNSTISFRSTVRQIRWIMQKTLLWSSLILQSFILRRTLLQIRRVLHTWAAICPRQEGTFTICLE